MKYEFEVYQMNVEDHLFWVAKSKALKGCVGQGETSSEAIAELELNEADWLETAEQCGIPIPSVCVKTDTPQYSGKVSLRFSPFIHEQAVELSKRQGISLNQYINDAIVYYNSMLSERGDGRSLLGAKTIEKTSSSVIQFGKRKPSSKVTFSGIDQIGNLDEDLEEM